MPVERERAERVPELGHRRGRLDALADDVADDEPELPVATARIASNQSPPTFDVRRSRQVASGELDARRRAEATRAGRCAEASPRSSARTRRSRRGRAPARRARRGSREPALVRGQRTALPTDREQAVRRAAPATSGTKRKDACSRAPLPRGPGTPHAARPVRRRSPGRGAAARSGPAGRAASSASSPRSDGASPPREASVLSSPRSSCTIASVAASASSAPADGVDDDLGDVDSRDRVGERGGHRAAGARNARAASAPRRRGGFARAPGRTATPRRQATDARPRSAAWAGGTRAGAQHARQPEVRSGSATQPASASLPSVDERGHLLARQCPDGLAARERA